MTALYLTVVASGLSALLLFLVGLRRLFAQHAAVVSGLVRRHDERLAEFAQVLNDALALQRELAAGMHEPPAGSQAHEAMLRALEQARERLQTDAAIAVVGTAGSPRIASVGLSQEEVAHIARIGFPSHGSARAIQISFNGAPAPESGAPVRTGLVVAVVDSTGTLAVLSRAADRRFSEEDVDALDEVVRSAEPAIERSLQLREPDPVPELDPVSGLFERQAFPAVLDREIHRARLARRALSLVVVDVDRLTTINARLGHLGGDELLAEIGRRLGEALSYGAFAFRLEGGRFAALLTDVTAQEAEAVFQRFRAALAETPPDERVDVSVSGGVAELSPTDDVASFTERADASLRVAKQLGGRGTIVAAAQ